MWFTPCSSSSSSVRSASSWVTFHPSAAAPKIVRELSWPVLPKGALAITARAYTLGARDRPARPRVRAPARGALDRPAAGRAGARRDDERGAAARGGAL